MLASADKGCSSETRLALLASGRNGAARLTVFCSPGYRARMAEPGDLLDGRYRLDELIGRGGMATVFRAWDTQLGRPVAVKLLRPEIVTDPDLALRFRREAHAAAVLHHPAVVGYLGSGTDGSQPFLVMELVDGDDLATSIRHNAPLAPRTAVRIATDVASGLAVAHARGIVHRDVKPGNIILDGSGRARITDFGVARIAAESEATIPGTTLGSVHYFSPEQARGLPTTPASDVYSLGLVLYEMVTGTRPFTGETTAAIALARVGAPAPHPRAVDPTIPPTLDAVVAKALNQDPAARYPDGGAFADALERTLATVSIPAPVAVAADPTSTTARFAVQAQTSAVGRSDRAVFAPLLGIAAAIALLFGGFVAFAALGAGPGEPTVLAEASDDPGASAVAAPPSGTPAPASDPPATPDPTTAPTAQPAPADPGDLCEPDPGATCALAAGTYTPSQFEPELSIDLDDGWETFRAGNRLVVLARDEGYLTLASSVSTVFDGDAAYEVRANANDLLDAFRSNTAVMVLEQRRARVDGHRAVQLDVMPSGDRAPLFGSGDDVFYVEPQTVTRLYVFEVRGEPVILALEGANGVDLDGFLDAADGALSSLNVG
jgi:tRNA A-37 threonylcarbamoyl transferase component Bud32